MIITEKNKNNMVISSISISKNKNRLYLEKCKIIKSIGIDGDEKGGKSLREISIYLLPTNEGMDFENGLCVKKFKANLNISGYTNEKVETNTLLKIASTLLKVTSVGKKCYDNCDLIKNKLQCSLTTNVLFCSIINEGNISLNDSVSIIK